MGPSEQKLHAVVAAEPFHTYEELRRLTELSESVELCASRLKRVASDPGWTGISAQRAAEKCEHDARRTFVGADSIRIVVSRISEANRSLERAKTAAGNLPPASLDDSEFSVARGTGSLWIPGVGKTPLVPDSVESLTGVEALLAIAREAEATRILRVLDVETAAAGDLMVRALEGLSHLEDRKRNTTTARVVLGSTAPVHSAAATPGGGQAGRLGAGDEVSAPVLPAPHTPGASGVGPSVQPPVRVGDSPGLPVVVAPPGGRGIVPLPVEWVPSVDGSGPGQTETPGHTGLPGTGGTREGGVGGTSGLGVSGGRVGTGGGMSTALGAVASLGGGAVAGSALRGGAAGVAALGGGTSGAVSGASAVTPPTSGGGARPGGTMMAPPPGSPASLAESRRKSLGLRAVRLDDPDAEPPSRRESYGTAGSRIPDDTPVVQAPPQPTPSERRMQRFLSWLN
ncbi:hypothetical protein GCM10022198_18160 [Klugiella xanthotipulae]|uniref:Uncharacterized protein n=1 Tax=Klugiella xanthotipulae TaxID=244735 RepID=A0A543HRZ5_9MICO|nr:hypothetical protein [Klugiella xanthotipulae]TQM61019.1 hypothetical protein FB466_1946 [Klugiella xanthotipulae]